MKDKIILYTTHCPLCQGVELQLHKNNIEYEEITDVDVMTKLGFTHVPVLSVNDKLYMGKDIFNFINERK